MQHAHTAYKQYAHALDASRQGKVTPGDILAEQLRRNETPDIARATAISNITPYLDKTSIEVLQDGLKDSNAMVRLASVMSLRRKLI